MKVKKKPDKNSIKTPGALKDLLNWSFKQIKIYNRSDVKTTPFSL